jgi:ABC-type branched-subunit amino acid transport system ATPase component
MTASIPGTELADNGSQPSGMLRLEGVTKHFGGLRAVDHVDLLVPRGEIVGLIGPNGAGKSTVIGIVGGAIRPDEGRIVFDGHDVTRLPPHARARLGLVRTYQLSSEFKRMTVLENLVGASPAQKGERFRVLLHTKRSWAPEQAAVADRAREVLARVGLADQADEYAGSLSGGEKRLLELGRAIMAGPRMIELDEPMAGVNPTFMGRIEEYIEDLRNEGVSILLVEHELGSVERLCSHVVVMSWGRVLAEGSMSEVKAMTDVQDAYLVG